LQGFEFSPNMIKKMLIWVLLFTNYTVLGQIYLPIATSDRANINQIELTNIGMFGELRKARPNVPQHLHTGIDIKRPVNNYYDEPIFPICEGLIISIRNDGPYAQIIMAHQLNAIEFWSVYEHIAEISCEIGEHVSPYTPIARYFNTQELNNYGWQFDHFHLEILKQAPPIVIPTTKLPYRHFATYWLSCYSRKDLHRYYWNPLEFLDGNFQ